MHDFVLFNLNKHLPQAIFWKDKNLVLRGCNLIFAQRLGYASAEEVIGKTDYDFMPKDMAEKYRKDDADVIRTGKPKLNFEEIFIEGNGTRRVVLVSKVPFYNDKSEILGVLGIYTDITERKQLENDLKTAKEKSEAANQAKTEFLENMRHDIRTPLTGIVGFSDIIKSEATNPKIIEYSDNLIASSHALLELMDEVLEAIRVGSGEIGKSEHKFSLQKTLEHVINLNKAKALSKKIELNLDYDENIPQYIISDNVRIHRIALELVANALNFTDQGRVTLKVELAKEHNRELIIKLAVIDTGIGIPQDKQNIIFQQFKRLTPSYQGIYKGAGLGLTIIKQFVDEINGEIYVKSTPKEGSTFTCVIPVKKPLLDDDEFVDSQFDTTDLTPESGAQPKALFIDKQCEKKDAHHILVVEDSIVAQTIAKAMLSQCDCEVSIADTGIKAQEMWLEYKYDLIFMDIGLPDIDGYEVTHFIRSKEASSDKHTPIVALTAHIGAESKKRCIEAGMNAVLSKPLTKAECVKVLDSFIPSRGNTMTDEARQYAKDLPQDEKDLFILDEFSLLDIEQGVSTTGDEDMLREMIKLMLDKTLEDDLTLLKNAHNEGDWDKTQKIAHKIKGGLVYLGANKLKMACQYLERYYKSGQRTHLEKLFEQVIAVSEQTISEFKNYLM